MKKLNVGIIGAGLIGGKRASAIANLGQDKIFAVADKDFKKAEALAKNFNAKALSSWQELIGMPEIDAVIVATTTDVNVNITQAALLAKKHVLAEKPLGSTLKEASKLLHVSQSVKKNLKVGYNHRHHPAVSKAYEIFKSGKIGKLFYIRSIYGHGARPGYDLEWRMQKKFSYGGELFDQGVHIIDMASWFMGNTASVFAQNRNFYWKKSDLEDNAFCQLFSKTGQIASFQVSLTQWRNKFLFEVYGSKGYLLVNGLGKSYGTETLTLGTNVGQGKVPTEEVFTYESEDISWQEEWREFKSSILEKRQPLAGAQDNLVLTKILAALYKSAKLTKVVKI